MTDVVSPPVYPMKLGNLKRAGLAIPVDFLKAMITTLKGLLSAVHSNNPAVGLTSHLPVLAETVSTTLTVFTKRSGGAGGFNDDLNSLAVLVSAIFDAEFSECSHDVVCSVLVVDRVYFFNSERSHALRLVSLTNSWRVISSSGRSEKQFQRNFILELTRRNSEWNSDLLISWLFFISGTTNFNKLKPKCQQNFKIFFIFGQK